ncbi:atherin-like [Zootoca vivipara]|uniref:atherin-like n=1 Tax=Zootoca vivipara TaxID=8524 RepID=UPI00293B9061|nr:atherin-like [Zootoca vivipara]
MAPPAQCCRHGLAAAYHLETGPSSPDFPSRCLDPQDRPHHHEPRRAPHLPPVPLTRRAARRGAVAPPPYTRPRRLSQAKAASSARDVARPVPAAADARRPRAAFLAAVRACSSSPMARRRAAVSCAPETRARPGLLCAQKQAAAGGRPGSEEAHDGHMVARPGAPPPSPPPPSPPSPAPLASPETRRHASRCAAADAAAAEAAALPAAAVEAAAAAAVSLARSVARSGVTCWLRSSSPTGRPQDGGEGETRPRREGAREA